MIRALIVGDIHITRKRIRRSKQLLKRISETIDRLRPDMTVLLGDVHDTHDTHANDTLTAYSEFIIENRGKTTMWHILGNHECNDSRTFLPDVHVLKAWYSNPDVRIVDKPASVTLADGTVLGFVPYTPIGRFSEAAQMMQAEPHIAFAHQEFKGCLMASLASEYGDPQPPFKVISGHIHGAQTLGNVWYPGTPCQQNFGEDQEKYIYLIEISGGDYKIIEQIDLEMPKFITVHSSATEYPEIPLDTADVYRIVVKDAPENLVSYKLTKFYKKMLANNVRFKFVVVREEAKRIENEKNLNFTQRFLELIEQENLKDVYEDIFT